MNYDEITQMAIGLNIYRVYGLYEGSDSVVLVGVTGNVRIYHEPDCCESVDLYDFDLTGELRGRVLSVEAVSGESPASLGKYSESHTWTFLKIRTEQGDVTMRWLGESNGYYSEMPRILVERRST